MDSNKKYWKGLEELNKTTEFVELNKNEFAEPLPIEEVLSGAGLLNKTPRRNFLKAMGFGVGAVTLAACEKVPVHKSIPYLVKPEEVTPGVANYYTSTYEGQAILVKTREGRPIKVEGNPSDIIGGGGLSARAQASVLDLYDVSRLKNPLKDNGDYGWEQLDGFVKSELTAIKAGGKKIGIITSTITSPSTLAVIADFITAFPTAKHINYDAVSYTGIIQGNQNSFGKAVLPHYNFDKADVIVSFGADFLGTWISPVEFIRQYVQNRNNKSLQAKKMSRHIQFETAMSITGTNADARIPIKPSEEGPALIALYNAISGSAVQSTGNKVADNAITLAAKELAAAKGKALVVAGTNDVATQILVNAINVKLGSYGTTIDLDNPSHQYAGNDAEFADFVSQMNAGTVDAVFFLNANPVYDYYKSSDVVNGLKKVRLRVSFSDHNEETAAQCNIIAPNHHYLESWGDDNALEGYYTLLQPTINPVYDTRQAEQSLLIWSDGTKDYYHYVRNVWDTKLLAIGGLSGQKGWETLQQTGFVKAAPKAAGSYSFNYALDSVMQKMLDHSKELAAPAGKVEIQLYQTVAMRDGKRANNPWLQELPDPVSKVTWDNYANVSPNDMRKWGYMEGDVVKIDVTKSDGSTYSIGLPVSSQPGQAQGTISVAVGYGRTIAGPVGDNVGKNAFPFQSLRNGTIQTAAVAALTATGDNSPLAQTQTHHSIEGRTSIIKETTFKEYLKNPASRTGEEEDHKDYDLFWQKYEHPTFNWVMAIDLNACTGCGACVVACSAENNVPVVGKDQVHRRREMHWIRIDRYYSFNDKGDGGITEEHKLVNLDNFDDVKVVYQPMLCQHCDHAPCETVCPVLATTHSSEGLNHMAYNRCIGTRYCANNCPYKVRRFNWFNYWNDARFENYLQGDHTELVLNPDVVTRFRGVMEKCSMCIQRIQAGKLKAKIEKRPVKDGDIKVACQQTCPANAIIFGDGNDPNSQVSKALKSERTYYVLEELGVQPGVGYQVKVRNLSESEA